MADRILMTGLVFHGRHGVFPEERRLGARFAVDVEATIDLRAAGERDDLAATADYGAMYEQVRAVLPSGVRTAVETDAFLMAASPWNRPRRVLAIGTDGDYFQIKKYNLSAGRAFTPQEVRLGSPVMVIGTDVAEHFFPSLDPIGRELRVAGVLYQVVGVLEKQGSLFGFSLDQFAIAPYTSPLSRATNPRGDVDALVVQAPREAVLAEAMEETRSLMRSIRGLSPSPGAWFEMPGEGARVRIKALRTTRGEGAGAPGTVLDGALTIACGEGAVRILELQRAGRQAMKAAEFLRGVSLRSGMRLS